MKITDLLFRPCIRVPLTGSNKTAVITELVDVLHENRLVTLRDEVLQAILARERIRSTGVGEGLAVPHAKCGGVPKLTLAVGKPQPPMDFDSPDSRPCQLIVLLVGPKESAGPHLQALAAISRLWLQHTFRESVDRAASADELFDAFEQHQR